MLPVKENSFTRIWAVVAKIPAGCVSTYGQVALLAGIPRGARVAGFAMRAVPKERKLPCHRVIKQSGELAHEHVFGGQDYQRMLLESEGVTFLKSGLVDMKKHLWRPAAQ